LNWWISSKNSETARNEVKEWAVKYVGCLVRDEAKIVTKSKILQTRDKVIDQQFVQAFSFSTLNEKLKEQAPVGMHILKRLVMSYHAQEKHTERCRERTKMVSTTVT
jgi:predicted KAP-like P-loop ATPase